MAKKFMAIILLFTVIILVTVSCSNPKDTLDHLEDVTNKENSQNENDNENKTDDESNIDENSEDIDDKEDNSIDSEDEEVDIVVSGVASPLSGIIAPEEKVNRRPVAIIIDNHPKARWQAGLVQAEVVYEFPVEFPYTRYMAVFLINDPKEIGPIRSSRPYFVNALLEYDAVCVRVGGSDEANAYIERLNLADLDATDHGGFWRVYETGKKPPNNTYSSMEVIRKNQKARRFRSQGNYEGFKFYEKDTNIEGKDASTVTIHYNNSNKTKYVFDEQEKVYLRYKDEKLHIDEIDDSSILVENIIIQKAKTKIIDDEGRLSIDTIGSGEGYYITNGNAVNIKWEKQSGKSKTKYYDESGQEIKLNIGQTWIQVVKLNSNIEIR